MSSAGRAIKTVVHFELLLEAEGCLIEEIAGRRKSFYWA